MSRFSDKELSLIKEYQMVKTYREIGDLIGRPMKCVSEAIRRRPGFFENKIAKIMAKKKARSYRAHTSWASMISRCTNPKAAYWILYGGRGISVHERWKSFKNFLSDMGEKPSGYSIDRIDPNGNYEPGNCRWIPRSEQSRTSRKYLSITNCIDCGNGRGNHAGRCHKCGEYFRRNKRPRPNVERVPCSWLKKNSRDD